MQIHRYGVAYGALKYVLLKHCKTAKFPTGFSLRNKLPLLHCFKHTIRLLFDTNTHTLTMPIDLGLNQMLPRVIEASGLKCGY